jgi:hypothetical protein
VSDEEFMSMFGGAFDRESKSFDKIIPIKSSFSGTIIPPFSFLDLARSASKVVQFTPEINDAVDDISRIPFAGKWQPIPEFVNDLLFGESSDVGLVPTARDLGYQYPLTKVSAMKRPEFWTGLPVSSWCRTSLNRLN